MRIVDEKTRRAAYLQMFANGAPAQVETLATVALNDTIVVREVATLQTGKVINEISVYRIEKRPDRARLIHFRPGAALRVHA